VLPAALLLRRQPEDLGLLPDGIRRDEWQQRQAAAAATGDALEAAVTPREALRSRTFYLLTLAGMGSPFAAAGLNLHLFPYLTDTGVPETTAVVVVSTWLATNVAGSLVVGFLAERFTARRVTLWSYALAAGPVLALPLVRTAPAAFAYALVQGVGQGGSLALRLLWADYFGRRHQGAIRGMTLPAQNLAIACGPIAGALVFDLTGGYAQAFTAFGVSLLLACGAVFLARPPRGRSAAPESPC